MPKDPEIDVVVSEYLHGKTSMDEAVAKISEPQKTFVDYVLKLVLPGDLYQRRRQLSPNWIIRGFRGFRVAETYPYPNDNPGINRDAAGNAALIVEAVNTHEAARAVVVAARAFLNEHGGNRIATLRDALTAYDAAANGGE